MTDDLILTNARLVLADEVLAGTLLVRDGLIADIAPGPSRAPGALDLEGDHLLPGLVELHTDNLEKHLVPRQGVDWPGLSALLAHDAQIAGAGITTVFDAVAVGDTDGKEERLALLGRTVSALREACALGALKADHRLHLRCEIGRDHILDLFAPVRDDPLLALVSVMDHTPGDRQYADLDRYRAAYRDAYGPHEIEAHIARRVAMRDAHAQENRSAIVADAAARGIPVASHDDRTEGHVREAKALGIAMSEFPTTRAAAQAARAEGMTVIMGAPNVIRGGSHSGNVSARDLAAEGLVDALSSDYMPVSLLHAPFRLVAEAGLSLAEAIALVTSRPAAMIGLADRGRLAVGLRADLVRARPLGARPPGDCPLVRAVWRGGVRVA
ncbi:MAG: alpha-D-ribose 1-methylphosphonate 5-triphosphate diphosphatase [Alphaproteobacteria bacterium]|nr:alpha-D-ribose 1-methylphosphonate 5-triphosphate diphosphatase [Alphaproteobacteria bacterium]